MVEDLLRNEEQNMQSKNRMDDPETMDHFEFMTKTVKKLQQRINTVDKLVTQTEKTLDNQMNNIRDKISKEKKDWVKKHPEMMEQDASIN